MIEHIVLIKFKNQLSDEQLNGLIERTMALKDFIPGIIDIQQGRDFSNRSKGYEIGLTVRFENQIALENYDSHPKHIEIKQHLQELGVEDIIVVDFKF
ncbi:Dabb family protein [Niallia sp. XMNu-256]|uniref:Dabb family protein n=1 Tax=Niallia sp. XMNu-256 TaxID=3082444 RepID=UPI0030D5D821